MYIISDLIYEIVLHIYAEKMSEESLARPKSGDTPVHKKKRRLSVLLKSLKKLRKGSTTTTKSVSNKRLSPVTDVGDEINLKEAETNCHQEKVGRDILHVKTQVDHGLKWDHAAPGYDVTHTEGRPVSSDGVGFQLTKDESEEFGACSLEERDNLENEAKCGEWMGRNDVTVSGTESRITTARNVIRDDIKQEEQNPVNERTRYRLKCMCTFILFIWGFNVAFNTI